MIEIHTTNEWKCIKMNKYSKSDNLHKIVGFQLCEKLDKNCTWF